jgi:hypothetical protein
VVCVVLLHNDGRPHTGTAARTQELLEHFNWELFDHTPYSPDLAPSDYHLFTYLNNWLGSQRSQAVHFFDIEIQKLIPRYDKCLNSGGNYVEK